MGRKQAIDNPKRMNGVGNPYCQIGKISAYPIYGYGEIRKLPYILVSYVGLESIFSARANRTPFWKIHVIPIRLRELYTPSPKEKARVRICFSAIPHRNFKVLIFDRKPVLQKLAGVACSLGSELRKRPLLVCSFFLLDEPDDRREPLRGRGLDYPY